MIAPPRYTYSYEIKKRIGEIYESGLPEGEWHEIQLTKGEADLLYNLNIWKLLTPEGIVYYQLFQKHVLLPVDLLRNTLTKLLGRSVNDSELISKSLKQEVKRILIEWRSRKRIGRRENNRYISKTQ